MVSIAIVVIIALTLWSNTYFYDKKMKIAEQSLAELIEYEEDTGTIL